MSDDMITGNQQVSDDNVGGPQGETKEGEYKQSAQNGTSAGAESIKSVRFAPIEEASPSSPIQNPIDMLLDVNLELSVELGTTSIQVRDVLNMGPGSIVELEKLAGEPVDILINGKSIAKGEVVVVDDHFGVRVTEISSRSERMNRLA